MKKLYHRLMAKYYGWRVKRFYKHLFKEMPMHRNLYVEGNGKLVYVNQFADVILVTGSGQSSKNWPTLKGRRIEDEYA